METRDQGWAEPTCSHLRTQGAQSPRGGQQAHPHDFSPGEVTPSGAGHLHVSALDSLPSGHPPSPPSPPPLALSSHKEVTSAPASVAYSHPGDISFPIKPSQVKSWDDGQPRPRARGHLARLQAGAEIPGAFSMQASQDSVSSPSSGRSVPLPFPPSISPFYLAPSALQPAWRTELPTWFQALLCELLEF